MQKKVLTTVLAASAIGAMVLSGCSSSKKTTGALGSSTPTAAASASAGGGSCNGTGTTYKIGYQGPLTGDNKQLGINMINAVNLAVDAGQRSEEPLLPARGTAGRRPRHRRGRASGRGCP